MEDGVSEGEFLGWVIGALILKYGLIDPARDGFQEAMRSYAEGGYSYSSNREEENQNSRGVTPVGRSPIPKSRSSSVGPNQVVSIEENGTYKYGPYESVVFKVTCSNGASIEIYYNDQNKCWSKHGSYFSCQYTHIQSARENAAKTVCKNN